VFNWNTVGAGYSVIYSGLKVFALNRTGALPVTYIPEGVEDNSNAGKIAHEAMEHAYRYYATLDDPNLARVFQYTALYQLFRDARTAGSWAPTDKVVSQPQPEIELRKMFVSALKELRDHPDNIIRASNVAPNAKLLASQAADIVEMAEKTKKNLAKYSDDALI